MIIYIKMNNFINNVKKVKKVIFRKLMFIKCQLIVKMSKRFIKINL